MQISLCCDTVEIYFRQIDSRQSSYEQADENAGFVPVSKRQVVVDCP